MPSQPFLNPRLVGARFEGHEIPLDVLRDFAVLEEFVKEVAKWHFFRDNPSRARSPRGFLKDVSLRLAAVEDGSAIPKIVLSLASAANLLFNQSQLALEQSRDSIIAAVAAAQHGHPPTKHLPESLLGYFETFGRSLRSDEAIEFEHGSDKARLTTESRRRLLAAAKNVAVTETVAVVGAIPEADQDRQTFQIQVVGKKFPAKEFARHREVVMQAFNGYSKGERVRLRGIWRLDSQGELEGVDYVESIDIVDSLDVPLRVQELLKLKDGWLDGEGKGITEAGAAWFIAAFEEFYSQSLVLPHVYPTENGGLRAEWTIDKVDASLDVDLETRKAAWHELKLTTDEESAISLNLSKRKDWEWVVNRINELGGVRND